MRGTTARPPHCFAAFLAVLCLATVASPAAALPPTSTPLTALTVTATTGEKPQSKVWTYAGKWWCVMPNSSGTYVWRLDGATWTSILQLSTSTGTHADVKAIGAVSHVLLFNYGSSQLASIEYVPATQTYQFWSTRPANVALPLDGGTETATLDVDSQGRMWIATDFAASTDQVVVYYADAPYSSWSGPVTVATGINGDDISVVTAMPGGKIGVMWSNQNTKRFGFRTHVDGSAPGTWTADEVPASQSALNVGAGMADDHLHVAVGTDGTLYAAVKTSYDTGGYPKMALLVRRPAGTWDNLYPVDEAGTRAIVLLDEAAGTVTMVYSSSEGSGNIIYKESPTSAISMTGPSTVLMPGGLNDAMSMKQNIAGSVVIVAGNGSSLAGMLLSGGSTYTISASAGAGGSITPVGAVSVGSGGNQTFAIAASGGYAIANVLVDGVSVGAVAGYTFTNVTANHTIAASFAQSGLVGWWKLDGDVTDASGNGFNATAFNSPTYVTGMNGQALSLNGTSQYASVPHNAAFSLTNAITLATWVKPGVVNTQNLISKSTNGGIGGYELCLATSSSNKAFFRINQVPSADAYRINSTTLYSTKLNTWMHLAATYDGATMKLYVNGVLESSLATTVPINQNTLPLAIGAQVDGAGAATRWFQGALDDARIYNRALSASEIAALANVAVNTYTIAASAGANGSISPSGSVAVTQGANQAFAITASGGFHVADVLVDAVSVGAVAGYTFTNVQAVHTIAASFAADAQTFTITASAGANGSISPSGAVVVSAGASQAFAIAATTGYHIADVLVDGGSVGAVAGYTFSSVAANHTIAASFAADGGSADLVGWWKLDGGVADASTYVNTGSLPNGGTWVNGVEGQALSLNGTTQYASVPHSTSLNLTTGLTLAAWIKPGKLGTQPLIAKETYGTPVWGYALELSQTAPGRPFFRLDNNTPGSGRLDGVTAYPQDGNTWQHVAATYDGATMKLYVNGVLDASLAHSGAIPTNTLPLAIGAQSTGEASRWFQGAIDEARVYNRALSLSEIQALMNHTITASAAAQGSITPAGAVAVVHGANQAFAITATTGYHVADVLVDGVSVGALAGYTFTNVTRGHTIAASFTVDAPPAQPTLAAPANQATGVATPPTLDVVPTDPDSPTLTVNFYGRTTNGPPGPDFTVVALPDAQYYAAESGGARNAMYKAQTQWCVNQRLARRIAYVAQLGDCVNDASITVEWMRSDTTFKLLEDPVTTGLADGIPYGVAVGNHDQYPKSDPDNNSTVNYNQWFGATRFQGRGYYGGHFADNNDSWFHTFSASGVDFIVISLEYDLTPDANRLAWADSLLKVYAGRRAIVVSHSIIGPGNPASWDGPGQAIYDALKNNPNLFLMLCGHVGDQGVKQSVYNGHTVYSLLSDYQGWTNGGDGYLRYMEFSPANNVIRVRTYSPWLGQSKVTADSASQFTLPYDMSGTSAFQLIGTATNVASGAHATISWPGLAAGTQCEWYVTVSDGASSTTSTPTWTFTTAGGGAPPDPITDLAVAPQASGNGTAGTIKLRLSWTPPSQGGTAQVYRKAFGDYPRYRAGVGAVPDAPATPAAAAAAGWTLTAVTAPEQSDQPAQRGYWYYVVFTTGSGGPSGVSNRVSALGYLLGDVHNGAAACSGDNQVSTADIAYLGGHYGAAVGTDDLLACLDVGPTSDGGLTSRPAPDGAIEFEDLVVFALNYGTTAAAPATLRPAPSQTDAIALAVPALPGAGSSFAVSLRMSGTGRIAALSAGLDFDPRIVEPVGVEGGGLLASQGVPSVVLSAAPGRVDVALLGGAGLAGEGELAQVRFLVKAAGDARLRLATIEARDVANRRVDLGTQPGAETAPLATAFAAPAPNPFRGTTTLAFALAKGGAVSLAVYSVDGRRVASLLNEVREAGAYRVWWDGAGASPGLYYARLVTPEGRFTRTLVLMK